MTAQTPTLIFREEGPSQDWYVCSVCDEEIETDPADALPEFAAHVQGRHPELVEDPPALSARLHGRFIHGGLAIPPTELPDPRLATPESVYQDPTGQVWRIEPTWGGNRAEGLFIIGRGEAPFCFSGTGVVGGGRSRARRRRAQRPEDEVRIVREGSVADVCFADGYILPSGGRGFEFESTRARQSQIVASLQWIFRGWLGRRTQMF
jgi:hypothetical protein